MLTLWRWTLLGLVVPIGLAAMWLGKLSRVVVTALLIVPMDCQLAVARLLLVQMKGTCTNLLSAPLACHVHHYQDSGFADVFFSPYSSKLVFLIGLTIRLYNKYSFFLYIYYDYKHYIRSKLKSFYY